MRNCRKTDADLSAGDTELKLAKVLAPEDMRAGDYVAVLHVVYELPSFLWCGDVSSVRVDEPIRVPFMSRQGGVPLKVCSVCLPFILVKTSSGALRNLDVRRHLLARLDRAHARIAWKASKRNFKKLARLQKP